MQKQIFSQLIIFSSILLLSSISNCYSQISIDELGAISNDNSLQAAQKNAQIISQQLLKINNTFQTLLIPKDKSYVIHPILVQNITNFVFQIDGVLIASNDIENWPTDMNNHQDIITFNDCTNGTITGSGLLDGQGYEWWLKVLLSKIPDSRPMSLVMNRCQNFIVEYIRIRNSPYYNVWPCDVVNITIRHIDIWADVLKQKELLNLHGQMMSHPDKPEISIPVFPLNTDGIDPSGRDIYIYNVSITNFDDAIAVKPSDKSRVLAKCSENIHAENITVKFSIGMAIGSVPPHSDYNCVNNVTFKNIDFDFPLKAIYVKTNPGFTGYGQISNIHYININVKNPLWWAIYIGPQQSGQPLHPVYKKYPVCVLYPIIKFRCETQPRVPITNVTITNFTAEGGAISFLNRWHGAVIRCSNSHPCLGMKFENVQFKGWLSQNQYICENADIEYINSNPATQCKQNVVNE